MGSIFGFAQTITSATSDDFDAVIWLDPGLAFGTGNHETTRLCCERLATYAEECERRAPATSGRRPERVLDAGCGSGILALSAARLGFHRVEGFDNDPEAVRVLLEMLDALRLRLALPAQSCVLAHVTTTLDLIDRGAPVDLVFQSIAGTEAANASFGVSLALLREAHDAARGLGRGTVGRQVMYFETGQGSALSAGAHHGVDQQTCEIRAYAVARAFDPLLVNLQSLANPSAAGWYRAALRRHPEAFPSARIDWPIEGEAVARPASSEADRVIRPCPSCGARLRLPAARSGTVECPRCRHAFDTRT